MRIVVGPRRPLRKPKMNCGKELFGAPSARSASLHKLTHPKDPGLRGLDERALPRAPLRYPGDGVRCLPVFTSETYELNHHSFDLEPPIECDDEYWDHPDPAKAWKQPPGKPSMMSYFLAKLRLAVLIPKCLRTIVRASALWLAPVWPDVPLAVQSK